MWKLPEITKGKFVKKGWGNELHIENNCDYCGKLLIFNNGKKFSMHYHVEKYETWYIQKGKLIFRWINPQNADIIEDELKEGDIVTIYQGISHQLEALEDSYRVWKGNSQK